VQPHSDPSTQGASDAGARDGDAPRSARLAVDIRQLPWTSTLAADYAFDHARLAAFFAGDPASPAAWRDAVARTTAYPRQRDTVADLLLDQQRRRGAPAAASEAAERLRDPGAVAVVTGQQAGLFGGPLYTLLKALTAIELAAQARAEHQVSAVPVFWVEAEDHDWDEVSRCALLDAGMAPQTVSAGTPPGAGTAPVARVRLDEAITATLAAVEASLQPTEFTPALLDGLRRVYAPGTGMAEAFARWLERLLGPLGLVVFDASDPAAKPLAASVFAREVARAGTTTRLAAEAGAALASRGYHAQVAPVPDTLALFDIGAGRVDTARRPIRIEGDGFLVGATRESRADLLARAGRAPAELSPNVLLRPIVQDTLFPTACYVAGPSELAYLGQLRGVYEAFEVPMPLVYPRATATLLDAKAMRFLTRHDVPLQALRARDDAALNEMLLAQLPPSVEASLEDVSRAIDERMAELVRQVPQVDPTLAGAAQTTQTRMQDDLRKLHNKVLQAAKRKDETLRRQFEHARTQAFPSGQQQERAIGSLFFLNRYGPALIDRLLESLPVGMGTHWVVTI
jgi:bacillithiol biosynthesis cysteine-adding enzyme BshC